MMNLLPCPFCGGEASITEIDRLESGRIINVVGCNNEECDVQFPGHARKIDAIKAWNARSDRPARFFRAGIRWAQNELASDLKIILSEDMPFDHRVWRAQEYVKDLENMNMTPPPNSLSEACDRARGTGIPPEKPIKLSSWEPCPLCGSSDIELHEDGVMKPEMVCTRCGISLQLETVSEVKQRWNDRNGLDNKKI